MSFEEARDYLDALGVDAMKAMKPSLHRIEAICDALDHPEKNVRAIHVTGTNGKSSTARIASDLLAATGLSVGTYTSPHLETITERIALNGDPIGEDVFGETFTHLRPYLELVERRIRERLTFFEVLTAMFFLWAAETTDAAVVEVGLGGRWDATNVVSAPVAVITTVAIDHTALLGTTREAIAKEKVGIIKRAASVVTAERAPSVRAIIFEEAAGKGAAVSAIDRDFAVTDNVAAVGGRYLGITTSNSSYEGMFLPLHGSHQGVNAAAALEAVTKFLPGRTLSAEVVEQGFGSVVVPGRIEKVGGVVLDVAHNPDGMSAFVSALLESFSFAQVVFVLGVLADKDYRGMIAELARLPCRVIATLPKNVRAADPAQLKAAADEIGISCEIENDVPAAVRKALEVRGDPLVCVTGSHYVVGEARSYLTRL